MSGAREDKLQNRHRLLWASPMLVVRFASSVFHGVRLKMKGMGFPQYMAYLSLVMESPDGIR
jgi:hypothetical protein